MQHPENGSKKVFIKTWGCQMNVYDSERMAEILRPLGYAPTDQVPEADLVIVNTCHIREKATEKLFSELGRLYEHKKQRTAAGKRSLLAVAGCVAQAEGAEIARRAPYVDLVFGPQSYHRLPEFLRRADGKYADGKLGAVVETDFPPEPKFDALPETRAPQGVSAFLSVQEGCDKFCTFCVVPYTRGAEYSRPLQAIKKEAENLVALGAKEIILLGQNVNAYHGEGKNGRALKLGELFFELAKISGLKRLRYTTSHPSDMDEALIEAHRDLPQLMPFLHLPVQSGSDRILSAMNRRHTVKHYHAIIDRLRNVRPDIALSSDFIVGFPGESDEDFSATMELIEKVGFAQAYSFKYSRRPGTPAAILPDQIEESVKERRLEELQALIRAQQEVFNKSTIGTVLPVLFDRKGRLEGQIHGRSPYMQAVHVKAPERMIGEEAAVKMEQCHQNSVKGELVLQDAA